MGCDIHIYPEYRKKEKKGDSNNSWTSIGGRLNPGRYYYLFGLMADGVRSSSKESFKLRGMPEDAGYYSLSESRYYISDVLQEPRCVTLEKAQQWAQYGRKITNGSDGKPTWVDDPDTHSHSWLTLEELDYCLNNFYQAAKKDGYTAVLQEYESLIASMQRLDELGFETRIVFWFDN